MIKAEHIPDTDDYIITRDGKFVTQCHTDEVAQEMEKLAEAERREAGLMRESGL